MNAKQDWTYHQQQHNYLKMRKLSQIRWDFFSCTCCIPCNPLFTLSLRLSNNIFGDFRLFVCLQYFWRFSFVRLFVCLFVCFLSSNTMSNLFNSSTGCDTEVHCRRLHWNDFRFNVQTNYKQVSLNLTSILKCRYTHRWQSFDQLTVSTEWCHCDFEILSW